MVDVERRIREVKIRYPRVRGISQSPYYNKEDLRRYELSTPGKTILVQEVFNASQEGDEQL